MVTLTVSVNIAFTEQNLCFTVTLSHGYLLCKLKKFSDMSQ